MNPKDVGTLTAEELRSVVRYDKSSGKFFWLASNNQTEVGSEAGSREKTGYIRITISGRRYMAHRLAYLYVTGQWPKERIDHRNLDRSDNSWDNLRSADDSRNSANIGVRSDNLLGIKGVRLHETGKYHARIFVNGKHLSLGLHQTPEGASAAYKAAAKLYFGEFARTS